MEKLTRLFTFIFLIGISLGLLAQKEGSLSIISQPQEVRRRDSILFDSIHNRRTLLLDSIDSIPKDSILLSNAGDSISRDSLYALLKDSIWADSMNIKTDSIPKDSLDSTRTTKKKKDSGLNEPVVYVAKDSMTFEGNNVATMFGDAQVNYQDIQLNAEFIAMNMDSSNVYAQGSPFKQDSSQTKPLGQPKFKDKSGEYESETMKYNFKSKKGYITNVYTKQGEGYVSGGISKKMPNDDMFMRNGRYTTCDKKDHPHYSFHLSKAKAKQGKNIVTGPANLVVEDFKIPVPIPFGFFPFSKTYSSGVIFPSFGQESTRGYYLKKGGYYFAINDYIDLAITGEIFTNGSWGLNALSYYTKRYKYNGNFNIERLVTITGEKGADDYKEAIDFKVHWTHTQNAKASLTSTFSASVDYSSSKYNQNQLDNAYNPSISAKNTKSSSINYQYRFLGIPLSLSASATINQRSADSTVSVTLPSLNITLSRVFPFKRKEQVGAEKWYEKIYLSYTGQIKNTIQTKEDKLFSSNLITDWKNGMQHNIPIAASFNIFKYLSITPSFNYTERWYKEKIMKEWDPLASKEVSDTVSGFYRVYNYSLNIGLSTKLYGFFKPWKMFGDKVQMIRHVLTPSISFSYAPDFGESSYGFWTSYNYINKDGKNVSVDYSPYASGIYGTAPRGKQGIINVSLQNNVEMKVRPKEKTKEEEEAETSSSSSNGKKQNKEDKSKISLIDNFTVGFSYNMAADSLNLSNISTSLRLKLFKGITTNINATFDTYTYDLDANGNPVRVNKLRLTRYGSLGRLSSASTSFSYTFNNDTFKKKSKEEKKKTLDQGEEAQKELDSLVNAQRQTILGVEQKAAKQKEVTPGEVDADGYRKLDIKWSLTLSYSLNCGYSTFNKEELEYNRRLNHSLSVSGGLALTKNWKFSFSTSWDFEKNELAMMTCNLSRNLHCWTFTGSFIPVGRSQSYYFTIALNSSMLKDLKWDKRSTKYEQLTWH